MKASIDRRTLLAGLATSAALPGLARAQQLELPIGLASSTLVATSLKVANELGFLEKRGIKPRFIVLENANAALTALMSRSVPVAVAGPAELIVANARGQKVVALANAYKGLGATVVLAKTVADKLGVKPDAPAQDRFKALDGLLIAAPSPTATYKIAIEGAARAAGATVRFTYMAIAAMPAALESGAVQGFIGSAPAWALPVSKGTGVLWISGPKGEIPEANSPVSTASVQAMREWADANATTARALAAALDDLATAVAERPADVKAAIARLYPDIEAPVLDVLFAAEASAWRTTPFSPADMKREIDFVRSLGAAIPDIDKVDPASLIFS